MRCLLVLLALLTLPAWSAPDTPERSFILMIAPKAWPADKSEHAALTKRMQTFGDHYLKAYRALRPELQRVIKIGPGQYNLIFTTRHIALTAMRTLPRSCADLLNGSDFEMYVSSNEPDHSAD